MDDTANESAVVEQIADNAEIKMSTEPTETPTKAVENEATKNESNSKNSSLEEDILGANSLLMSESDDDDVGYDDSVSKTEYQYNENSKVDNDEEPSMAVDDVAVMGNDKQTESKEIIAESPIKVLQTKKKKFSAILDSDTDDDEGNNKSIQTPTSTVKPKLSALIDTDSETDDEKKRNSDENEKANASKYKIFDFDDEESESRKTKTTKNKKGKVAKYGIIDSDSDSNSDTASSGNESANETLNNEGLETKEQMSSGSKKEAHPKQKRASAKNALDQIQTIQSEQQRLHREANISIPYHKPKRHTLQEFLKRRTIIKPGSDNECSPAAASLRQKPLKMTAEELEEYAKLMEDRAREAKEFFKSESESEEEALKPNEGVMDIEMPIADETTQRGQTEPIAENDTETMPTSQNPNELNTETDAAVIENELLSVEPMQIGPCEAPDVQFATEPAEMNDAEEHEPSAACSTQPIVTEILELPRLDLSTLHLAEGQCENILSPSKVLKYDGKSEDIKATIISELQSIESPRLKGDSNMLIDLESGDMVTKEPTGADNLLQRLLATHKAKKAKINDTVNILSTENGKLEMTTHNFHHHDETEVKKEQKPGAAYLKLKENLKTLIKKKRLEELQKKQEDEDEYNKCFEDDEDYEIDEDEEYEIENDRKVRQKREKSNYDIVIDDEENAVQLDDEYDEDNDDEEIVEEAEIADEVEDDTEADPKNEEDENVENFMDADAVEAEDDTESDSDLDEEPENAVQSDEKNALATFKEPLSTTQRKSRIIKPFAADSDHEDDDDDMDLLKTQLPVKASNVITPLFGAIDSPIKDNLSLPTNSINDVGNTQELLELCSGAFEATQKPTTTDAMIISQIPMTLQNSETDTTREILALCSGSFDNQEQETQSTACEAIETKNQQQDSKPTTYKILSSDEEETAPMKTTQSHVKKLRKKLKKGQVKLGFSDDEDESEATAVVDEPGSASETEHFDDDAIDMPETYVEYDSEENEIIVEMTKKDRIQHAENFFEKEAELSESEWGSADEDEKNLDQYDIELGDEDNFDREKLQQELGKIHARKMLDEDIREVRKIQEMLFEDEENDGVGRQRQFRWKNAESGFSLDDTNRGEDGGLNGGESGDEEQKQEHLWRKIRFEREQMLKEQGTIENSKESLTTKLGVNSPLSALTTFNTAIGSKSATPIIGSNGKKIQIITKNTTLRTTIAERRGSPFLISSTAKKSATSVTTTTSLAPKPIANFTPPSTATILQPKTARGSFLMRDKDSLTKFANFTKGIASSSNLEDNETAGTVSLKSAKAKNFVFATLTKEEHEHLKRKADDLINSSSENGTNFMKKPRTNNQNATAVKQCFIDKLLS